MSYLVKNNGLFVISMVLVFLLLGCRDPQEKIPPPSPTNLMVTQLDTELSLTSLMSGTISYGAIISDNVRWNSSDETLATVNQQGQVVVHAAGKVTLSVSYGQLTDSITIDINESNVSIEGQLFYEDKKYDMTGFVEAASETYNSIRYVTVDLLSASGRLLETTQSDSQGSFKFGHVIPEKYQIRVLAKVTAAPAAGFSIKDLSGAIYAVSKTSVSNQTSYTIKISQNSGLSAAFNMLDIFVSGAEYSKQALLIEAENLNVFWASDSKGSYYCTASDNIDCRRGKGIYVLNQTGDTDQFDDDVLLHEFGHFILDEYFKDDSPGGCHAITDNDLDLRLAWSEAWGTFFASAVKDFLQTSASERLSSTATVTSYIDTDGEKAPLIAYDMLIPPFKYTMLDSGDNFYYASSEFAVSHILWNVLKTYGMAKITDVLSNHFPKSELQVHLPNFWQGLLQSDLLGAGEQSGLAAIFADRKVFYQQDEFENNDNIERARLIQVGALTSPDHTLYKNDWTRDIDMFAFDLQAGQSYVVKTRALKNGSDTYLRILDANGEPLIVNNQRLENDDADPNAHYRFDQSCRGNRYFNSDTALASEVIFTANLSGRYYAEVSHISTGKKARGATGPYGSYQLSIE